MAFGIEFCMTKSSKSTNKQRGTSQQQSNRKNSGDDAELFRTNHTNGPSDNINGSNRNSQHSLSHREHHTTPTTTTTTNTTPNTNHNALVPHASGPSHTTMDHNERNSDFSFIRYVAIDYEAVMEDELSVVRGDVCLLEVIVDDEQGRSWSCVFCLTQNNARGFVPSEVLTLEKTKCAQIRKKISRPPVDHPINGRHQGQRHIDDHRQGGGHHYPSRRPNFHHHGPHHISGAARTVISNATAVGHISRKSQREVSRIAQCVSDKTPSNGGSFGFPHSMEHNFYPPHLEHNLALDIHAHPNLCGAGPQTFQNPPYPLHTHINPASYYNITDGHPTGELIYDRSRLPPDAKPFHRAVQGDLFVVLYNFVNREEMDISVKPGDFVYVLNKEDDNWYWVRRVEDDEEGFVPAEFIIPNDKAESVLNKGNSTVTMKSSNALELHTYVNRVADGESLLNESIPVKPM